MGLVINTDTYISAVDATTYISTVYMSTSSKYIAWIALSEANKEICLKKAAQTIDRQALVGFKALYTQTMEFPRIIYTEYNMSVLNPVSLIQGENWYIQPSVPDSVKHAQCELALEESAGTSTRVELQRQGVKSFSLGKLSETYTGTKNRIVSFEAKELLAPFIAGSVKIC